MSHLEEKSKQLDSSLLELNGLKTRKRQLQFRVSYLKRKIVHCSSDSVGDSNLKEITNLQTKFQI